MCEENKDDITENVKLFKKETLSNISSVKSKVRKFEPDANNKFHQNDSHAKAKVFVRSNPVFNPNRISSKVIVFISYSYISSILLLSFGYSLKPHWIY